MKRDSSVHFSIIIITRNSVHYIRTCILSLKKYAPQAEIIIVDNNSVDGTVYEVERFDTAHLIRNNKNKGFSFACHQAVRRSSREYLLFLNPDASLLNNVCSEVEHIFKSDERIGVIGPTITYPDGTIQRSVRRFPDFFSQVIMFLKIDHILPHLGSVRRYLMDDFTYTTMKDVEQVMGACFSTTRQLWNTLGGFDTRFFIWFEEVDYCYEAVRNGYRVVYAPIGPVEHALGKSFSREPLYKKQFWFLRSLILYFIKRFQ